MNFSEPFIRRPVMTTLVMLATLVVGIIAYQLLPVSNLPDVDYPAIEVSAALPGADPQTMANTVATPLEKEFLSIPGLKRVTSSSFRGRTSVNLEFDMAKSIDSAALDVEAALSRAKSHLPPNLSHDPIYKKINPSDSAIIYIALTSPTMLRSELYNYANVYIGQRISMLEGVAQVMTYGTSFAVRVQVDPALLATYAISLSEVADAIRRGNQNMPTGELNGKEVSSTIYTAGQLKTGEEYQPLIIAYRNGAPVRIRDIGKAIDSLQNENISLRYITSSTDQPTVVLAVQRQPGANTIKVAESIEALLPSLQKELPGSVEMELLFDRSSSIKESIAEVKFTLVLALILVVIVIFFYLGNIRGTIIPSIAMPMSIVWTFAMMYALSFSIDNLSLLALTLAVGFIVDDAIVVLENIVRRIEGGETPWVASLLGSKQISFTIISMTLSLIAVFIPLLFMEGLIGKIFQEFAITLAIVTLASGVVSLTLTPMLCSRFIPPHEVHKSRLAIIALSLNQWMQDKYKPILAWVFVHRKIPLVFGVLSIVLSCYFFVSLPKDFIPDEDIGFLIAYNEAQQGTSSHKMHEYQQEIIKILRHDPNILRFLSLGAYPEYRQGINFIRLKPLKERQPAAQVIQNLYKKFGGVPGVNTYLKNVPLIEISIGGSSKGAFQYLMQSLDTEALFSSTEGLVQKMRADKTFQGVSSNLEIKTPQLNVEILRDQAASLGVDAHEIENSLLLAYSGSRITRIQTPIDQYDVILELDPKYQHNPSVLGSLYVKSSLNPDQLIPLRAVAKWEEGIGPASINHYGQFAATTISFNIAPGVALEKGLARVQELAEEVLTPRVMGSVAGAAETFKSMITSSVILLIAAIFAIYIVLGILYESFIHPLTILSTLPPAILGALLTLYFFGMPLSLYSYLGIILLIGIVKKNGIMMVDYALENIRIKQETPEKAIFDACLVRFRPIMMTTAAAIMGALPIALGVGAGAESRRPLGFVIIGGLLFSQLITLLLTPVIYLYLERWNKKFTFGDTQR
jgi:hydrophobic/amphiphilic exporter-1 (mainly G- bacteria), HAE1 family